VLYPSLEEFPQRALAAKQMNGGGTMVAFSLKGGKAAAFKFLNALDLILISNNLGDAKSLATHPMTTTHQRLTADQRATQGIDDGLIRVSVGLEDVTDLIEDLERALAAA
jgi:O-succinylhomoserine sulfhydrylase